LEAERVAGQEVKEAPLGVVAHRAGLAEVKEVAVEA